MDFTRHARASAHAHGLDRTNNLLIKPAIKINTDRPNTSCSAGCASEPSAKNRQDDPMPNSRPQLYTVHAKPGPGGSHNIFIISPTTMLDSSPHPESALSYLSRHSPTATHSKQPCGCAQLAAAWRTSPSAPAHLVLQSNYSLATSCMPVRPASTTPQLKVI